MDGELIGWKQVADYLRVSIRTAQMLEKEQGLPIRRGAGMRGPVSAVRDDLDKWKTRPKLPTTAPELPTPSSSGENRRQWLRQVFISGSAVLVTAWVVAGISKLNHARAGRPFSHRIMGSTLIVIDENNRELWRHTFPEPIAPETAPEACRFVDLASDRSIETLFSYESTPDKSGDALYCFNRDGIPEWKFVPGKAVIDDRNRQFVPPFVPADVAMLRPRGSKANRVVVSSVHNYSFPTQIAVLEGGTGKVLAEYWHRGHLRRVVVCDLDRDGEPEILAGGVNDAPEYKRATLLVLDHRRLCGATPNPNGGSYFQGMAPCTAKRTVFFPKTAVSRLEEFNRVVGLDLQPERLVVVVAEGIAESNAWRVIYEFDRSLHLLNVLLTDQLHNRLLELQARGEIPQRSPEAIAEDLKREIAVL